MAFTTINRPVKAKKEWEYPVLLTRPKRSFESQDPIIMFTSEKNGMNMMDYKMVMNEDATNPEWKLFDGTLTISN